jgi:hypothetical protein
VVLKHFLIIIRCCFLRKLLDAVMVAYFAFSFSDAHSIVDDQLVVLFFIANLLPKFSLYVLLLTWEIMNNRGNNHHPFTQINSRIDHCKSCTMRNLLGFTNSKDSTYNMFELCNKHGGDGSTLCTYFYFVNLVLLLLLCTMAKGSLEKLQRGDSLTCLNLS